MKQGWRLEKLGDVCAFLNRGISPRYLEQGGICVLNQKCIRDHRVSYDQSRRHDVGVKSVGEDRFIQLGDVLVNSTGTGTLGRVAQVREIPPEPTTVDSHVTIVRPKPNKFFPDFFGYMLVFIEEAIKEAGEGCGGQTELARSVLAEKFTVSYPTPLPEQQRIVAILDEAFAAIAKAKANAEQNLKNAKELFESYLQSVFENKGEGWEEKTLGEVIKLEYGKPLDKSYRKSDGLYPMYGANGEKGRTNKFYCERKTIIVGRKGSAGEINLTEEKFWPLDVTYFVTFDEKKNDLQFLYYLLSKQQLAKLAKGVKPGINRNEVYNLSVSIPPLESQQAIIQKLDILSGKTKKLETIYQQRINDLEELKKSILQKAFIGELKTSKEVAL